MLEPVTAFRRALCLLVVATPLLGQAPPASPAKPDTTSPGGSFDRLRFRAIGPAAPSGRIDDFAVFEKNPAVFYVASATGGVWKTVNNGTTFTSGSTSRRRISVSTNSGRILGFRMGNAAGGIEGSTSPATEDQLNQMAELKRDIPGAIAEVNAFVARLPAFSKRLADAGLYPVVPKPVPPDNGSSEATTTVTRGRN